MTEGLASSLINPCAESSFSECRRNAYNVQELIEKCGQGFRQFSFAIVHQYVGQLRAQRIKGVSRERMGSVKICDTVSAGQKKIILLNIRV